MRKESTIVVYDTARAVAEEIADKLGAETLSVQSLDHRVVANAHSLVLGLTLQDDGQLTPLWQYGRQVLQFNDLHGKSVAVFVCGSQRTDTEPLMAFCDGLRKSGVHLLGQIHSITALQPDTDYWIASISPSLQ